MVTKNQHREYQIAQSYDAEWQILRAYWTNHIIGGWKNPKQIKQILHLWKEYVVRSHTHLPVHPSLPLPGPPAPDQMFRREGWPEGSKWGAFGGDDHRVDEKEMMENEGDDKGKKGERKIRDLNPAEKDFVYWRAYRVRQALGGAYLSIGAYKEYKPYLNKLGRFCEQYLNMTAPTPIEREQYNIEAYWERQSALWGLFLSGQYARVTNVQDMFVLTPPLEHVPFYMWLVPRGEQWNVRRIVKTTLKQRVYNAKYRSGKDPRTDGNRAQLIRCLTILDNATDYAQGDDPSLTFDF